MTQASKRHSSETLGEQVSRLTRKPPWALSLAEGQELTDLLVALYEQFDAMRDKLDSLYAGYSAKCERFSLGTCDRSADDGQLCRICQFFLGIGWESFEVTSGGLRSWRPVSNPAKRQP